MFRREGEEVGDPAAAGIWRAQLDPEQEAILDALVETFLSNFMPEVAAPISSADGGRCGDPAFRICFTG